MKLIAFAFLVLLIASCSKKHEEPCPIVYENLTSVITVYKVIAFIDKDSNNLLMNRTIDTADIVIKDEKGVIQKSDNNALWIDSTLSKMRYVYLPLIYKPGNHTLTVTVKEKTNTVDYTYHIEKERCYTNTYFDNFKLNGKKYEFKPQQDYLMYTFNGKSQKYSLSITPMYIVLL